MRGPMFGKLMSATGVVFCAGLLCAQTRPVKKARIVAGGASPGSGQVRMVRIGYSSQGGGAAGKSQAAKHAPVAAVAHVSSVGPEAVDVSSEFRLREVYVYPNPAKGGQVPTFHIESGVSDSVKVTVYTVAGEVAHTTTLSALPGAINDGNGVDYAYEYAWRGHIPSGVYYFTVEAQKAGKKLRRSGKFAVLR